MPSFEGLLTFVIIAAIAAGALILFAVLRREPASPWMAASIRSDWRGVSSIGRPSNTTGTPLTT